MASEMAEYTKQQIMTQSATAMLAQANQTPKSVLQLLS
jgi:flagellin